MAVGGPPSAQPRGGLCCLSGGGSRPRGGSSDPVTAGFCQESLQAAPTPRGGPVAGGPGRVFILTAHDTSKLAPAQRAPVPSAHTETLFSVPSERSCATRGLSPAVSQRVPTTRWGEVGGGWQGQGAAPAGEMGPGGTWQPVLGSLRPTAGGPAQAGVPARHRGCPLLWEVGLTLCPAARPAPAPCSAGWSRRCRGHGSSPCGPASSL